MKLVNQSVFILRSIKRNEKVSHHCKKEVLDLALYQFLILLELFILHLQLVMMVVILQAVILTLIGSLVHLPKVVVEKALLMMTVLEVLVKALLDCLE